MDAESLQRAGHPGGWAAIGIVTRDLMMTTVVSMSGMSGQITTWWSGPAGAMMIIGSSMALVLE
jgi:hypothetical protein